MKTKSFFFVMIIAALVMIDCSKDNPTSPPVDPKLPTSNFWTAKANLSIAMKTYTAVVNGRIYAMGGSTEYGGPQDVEIVYEYNTATDRWASKGSIPTKRLGFQACAVDGKIYVIGGAPSWDSTATNLVEAYDPVANNWTTKSSMETNRVRFCACTVNGKIYAIGGNRAPCHLVGAVLSSVEEYNPATDTWVTKNPMSLKRYDATACVLDGKIYVIGGCTQGDAGGSLPVASVEVYDPETDTWTSVADFPTTTYASSSSIVNGNIYVIGGTTAWVIGEIKNHTQNYMYDPAANTWTSKAELGIGRCYHSAEVINNKIYVIGGFDKSNVALSSVMMYTP